MDKTAKAIEARDVFQSIEAELTYVRKSIVTILTYILIGQSLVITGQKTIPGSHVLGVKLFVSVGFVLIDILSFLLASNYGRRITDLRRVRSQLITESGFLDPYQTKYKGPNTTGAYLYIIIIFSVLGIFLIWTGQ